MKTLTLAFVTLALFTVPVNAEVSNGVQHSPISCVRAGELPLLQVQVTGKGELRGYFRRVNATDWCSVEGTNDGLISRVVLPKFENGDEIEYFFILLDGTRVIARSPRIFRVTVASVCETPFARHMIRISMDCGEKSQAIPSSIAAGYLVGDEIVEKDPPKTSPDRP